MPAKRIFAVVAFFLCHLEQVGSIKQVAARLLERQHDAFQRLLFLAEVLGPLLVIPDGRVFEFLVDLF